MALRGGVPRLFGTDLSEEALATAGRNLTEALGETSATLECCDFRDYATVEGLGRESLSLVITNPPMGRRVPIPDLPGLIDSLFVAASEVLRPGGRLVFVNPLSVAPRGVPLRQDFRRRIDLGAFHCHLEKYTKV
jgi:tRNA G10  N-methylase Trm11